MNLRPGDHTRAGKERRGPVPQRVGIVSLGERKLLEILLIRSAGTTRAGHFCARFFYTRTKYLELGAIQSIRDV